MTSKARMVATMFTVLDVLVAASVLAQQQSAGTPATPDNPYVPPACSGIFTDVACPGGFAVNWIEKFYADGITGGCNAAPLQYCPDSPVTRAQMAVFVEKAMRGTATWTPGALGSYNTGLGAGSLLNNSPYAEYSTAIGYEALFTQSYANGDAPYTPFNTAVGSYALFFNQPDGGNAGLDGTENTAIGAHALYSNVNGYGNTAVGMSAGETNISGFGNTFVGYAADADTSGHIYATAIGYGAKVDDSFKVRIGSTSVGVIGGQVGWTAFSDARGKKDIADLDLGLDLVMALRPVSYRLQNGNGRTDMGFVAQDIEALLGDEYNVLSIGGDAERTLALRYTDLIAPVVKAIQEQQATIEAQQTDNASLKAQVATQQAQIEALKTALAERDGALERRLAALERKQQ